MDKKALILLLIAIQLSACGHLRSSPESADSRGTSEVDVATDTEFNPAVNQNGSPQQSEQDEHSLIPSDIVVPTTETGALPTSEHAAPAITGNDIGNDASADVANNQVPVSAQQTETQTPLEVDLLTRIRNGFSFPDLQSKHTAQYEKWSSQHATYLKDLFIRAEPFLFFIVEEIEQRKLPMELALLPAIESAYKPNALSRSKAGGLWQFIPSTGRHFGLTQGWWYDGRRDAIASTTAALDYLTELNTMFDGDWFLTLAAYNAGQGTIRRAIKKNKRKGRGVSYQQLSVRSETERYVPKLQALKNIIQHPERFGVTLPNIQNSQYFEVVELPGQIDLHDFAQRASIPLGELQHVNAGFLRWATPPEGPHRLVVPLKYTETTALAVKEFESMPPMQYQSHKIARGDTLSSIAQRYGVSVSALRSTNKLRSSAIREGKDLFIPIAAGPAHASRSSNWQVSSQDQKLVHTVVRGDTLWSIARRYQVKVQQLLSWNQLASGQILRLNQALLVFTN